MKRLQLAILGLGLGLAACAGSTTPMQSAASVRANPQNAPVQGAPPSGAAAACSGEKSQQGGGAAYLNCLQKHE
jgi:hypothetical protein